MVINRYAKRHDEALAGEISGPGWKDVGVELVEHPLQRAGSQGNDLRGRTGRHGDHIVGQREMVARQAAGNQENPSGKEAVNADRGQR